MPMIKVTEVLSYSSEDTNHPVENLLKPEAYLKWKCKAGSNEKQAYAILKLEKLTSIRSIDIGNEHSAFVEVLAGREGIDFEVLLVASSFMTPLEARNGTTPNRVRMFGPDKLNKTVANQKWDRIKVICTQPFNKNVQFGLNFIKINGPEELTGNESSETKLGKFVMKDDSESENISVGSFFAKRKEMDTESSVVSVAASIRAASNASGLFPSTSSVERKQLQSKTKEDDSPTETGFYQLKKKIKGSPNLNTSHPSSEEIKDLKKLQVQTTPSSSKKRLNTNTVVDKNKPSLKTDTPKLRKSRPFNKLMNDVVFVMSGYQNPKRSQLRSQLVKMGAKYADDWNDNCTHLICAFAKTPKFNVVKGKGKIVTEKWIEESYDMKIRFPWQRYNLEKNGSAEESEEEIWATEILPPVEKTTREPRPKKEEDESLKTLDADIGDSKDLEDTDEFNDSDEDTDDEIQRVLNSKLKGDNKEDPKQKEKNKVDPKQNDKNKGDPKLKNKNKEDPKQKDKNKKDPKQKRCSQEDLIKNEIIDNDDLNIKDNSKKDRLNQKGSASQAALIDSDGAYDTNTDDDEAQPLKEDTSHLPLPPLASFFKGKNFFFYGAFDDVKKASLMRYIVAFEGQVSNYMNEKVNFVITDENWNDDFDEALGENCSLQFVKSKWVWKCCDKQKLVPPQPYLVVPKD